MSLKKASRTKSLSLSEDFPMRIPKPKNLLTTNTQQTKRVEDTGKILKYIDDNIIGKGVAFLGPFGRRKVVYADYASSGRSLQFLEDYINKEVLPAFGDTECISAVTGLQSQLYSIEATDIIRSAVNASEDDHVFFCEGASFCLSERLCHILSTAGPPPTENESNSYNGNSMEQQLTGGGTGGGPVLFVSTNEPSKSLTPWLDAGAEVVKISKTREGFLDLVDLENKLSKYGDTKRPMIGLFAGASRLTGMLADDVATTILLHQYNAISIWDYSHAAPFAPVDMNPVLPGAAKDIVFFSTSKYIGGVQGPGVIAIKKHLLDQIPSAEKHFDTVGVIDAIRAGLVVQLKESLGTQCIASRQEKLCKQILAHIRTIPEIVLLGPTQTTAKRIPKICFLVKHPRGSYLHHRFVVAVLNDVFGIQATAANYIGEALGINRKLAVDFDRIFNNDIEQQKSLYPGYTKLLIPFFMTDSEVGFILEALKMVATEAWKLLPQYEVDDRSGEWRHLSNSLAKERKWLGSIRYTDGRMMFTDRRISGPGTFPQNYSDCLQTARNLFNRSRKMAQKSATVYLNLKLKDSNAETLRWYMLSGEAHELLLGHSQHVKNVVPFDPNKTKGMDIPSLLNMFRHNSLSALDVKRFKSRSLPTSPVTMPIRRQQSSPIRSESPKTSSLTDCTTPPVVRFTLGGEVTTLASFNSPRITTLPSNEEGVSSRNRCHSWSSTGGAKPINTQARIKLGLVAAHNQMTSHRKQANKPRLCSCSSQTELFSPDSTETSSPTPSLQNSVQAGSTCSDCAEEIQAYVAEVTKELATEIKSEIREVISRVEDVLENTDTVDSINMSSINLNITDDSRSDSVSATDIAEYLKAFSKEMTSEVKSEIREAVNAMTDIIPLDGINTLRKSSPPESCYRYNNNNQNVDNKLAKQRFSDSNCKQNDNHNKKDENKPRSESFPRPNSTPGYHQPIATAPSPESSTPNCPYTGAISKFIDPVCTASQDSGINMCFHETDETRSRTTSESLNENRSKQISRRSQSDSAQCMVNHNGSILKDSNCDCKEEKLYRNSRTENNSQLLRIGLNRRQQSESETDAETDFHRWHHLPKDVWKQTAEAIDEFDMVKEGDRILICLSGSSASLCLLHALRQFSRARGIHIDMAAITVGKCGIDPRALMLYMRDINIELFIEPLGSSENSRTKICSVARRKQYNVLAMGNTLDKLADDFLISVLNKGRLYAPQANCTNREGDLRIIRPFIYVRERQLEDFANQKNLPSRPSSNFAKPLDACNSILKVQETTNPLVYENIKSALRPLLSVRLEVNKSSYEYLKLALISRD